MDVCPSWHGLNFNITKRKYEKAILLISTIFLKMIAVHILEFKKYQVVGMKIDKTGAIQEIHEQSYRPLTPDHFSRSTILQGQISKIFHYFYGVWSVRSLTDLYPTCKFYKEQRPDKPTALMRVFGSAAIVQ